MSEARFLRRTLTTARLILRIRRGGRPQLTPEGKLSYAVAQAEADATGRTVYQCTNKALAEGMINILYQLNT
jgi:hypothetical protein